MYRFADEVHSYQTFVKNNLHQINYELIEEQFKVNKGFIDILAYNRQAERLAIIELKNPKANIKAVSQGIRYYLQLKNVNLNGYELVSPPEVVIIAPNFESNITLPDTPVINLIRMNYDDDKDCVYIEYIKPNTNVTNIETDDKPTIQIPFEQRMLAKRIITHIQSLYGKPLEIIDDNLHINILDRKLVAKIIFNRDWFNNYITLNIYKRFIKPINKSTIQFDPAIMKYNFSKTMTKLIISDLPQFLQKEAII